MKNDIQEIVKTLKKFYITDNIRIVEILYDSPVSKIYKINLEDSTRILKIKNRGPSNLRLNLLDNLINNGVEVAKVEKEFEGFILKEYKEGVSLNEHPEIKKQVKTSHELSCIYKDFGVYLEMFHNSLNKDNSINLNSFKHKEEHYREIIRQVMGNPNLNRYKEYKHQLVLYADIFIEKYMVEMKSGKNLGITHGDFHNKNNILIYNNGKHYKFLCAIDYDLLSIDLVAVDLFQVIVYILNKNRDFVLVFLKSYFKNYSRDFINKNLKLLDIINTLDLLMKLEKLLSIQDIVQSNKIPNEVEMILLELLSHCDESLANPEPTLLDKLKIKVGDIVE